METLDRRGFIGACAAGAGAAVLPAAPANASGPVVMTTELNDLSLLPNKPSGECRSWMFWSCVGLDGKWHTEGPFPIPESKTQGEWHHYPIVEMENNADDRYGGNTMICMGQIGSGPRV